MNGHTKGPWAVTYTRSGAANVGPSHDCIVAVVLMAPVSELVDNARLIATAPELLEAACLALSVAESWIHDQLDGTNGLANCLAQLEPVRASIAAATGETK